MTGYAKSSSGTPMTLRNTIDMNPVKNYDEPPTVGKDNSDFERERNAICSKDGFMIKTTEENESNDPHEESSSMMYGSSEMFLLNGSERNKTSSNFTNMN